MNKEISNMTPQEIFNLHLEQLAAIQHSIWSHWQKYLHSQCTQQDDGSLVIPKHLVEHWNEQIEKSYYDLTEDEKKSDIEQALKFNNIFNEIITKAKATNH